MRIQHVFRDRVTDALVAVVERYSQTICGQIRQRFVNGECRKYQRVPDFVIRRVPLVIQFGMCGRIHVQTSRAQ